MRNRTIRRFTGLYGSAKSHRFRRIVSPPKSQRMCATPVTARRAVLDCDHPWPEPDIQADNWLMLETPWAEAPATNRAKNVTASDDRKVPSRRIRRSRSSVFACGIAIEFGSAVGPEPGDGQRNKTSSNPRPVKLNGNHNAHAMVKEAPASSASQRLRSLLSAASTSRQTAMRENRSAGM